VSAPAIAWDRLREIVVFRALQLGDMLCIVPALRAVRRAAPRAAITLVGLPWARAFAQRYAEYVDRFIAFPGIGALPEQAPVPGALPGFIRAVRALDADLALQWHGSGLHTNRIVRMCGARRHAGFAPPGSCALASSLYLPWDPAEHEVLRYLRLLRALGIACHDAALTFPFTTQDHLDLRAAGPPLEAGGYVCVHPGARMPSRRWQARRFAEVADALARRGLRVVLTGGQAEQDLVREVMSCMREEALDYSGRTSLGSLALLLAGARLLVCNDTGVSHLAAAVATPSVVACCGSDPGRWAPLDRGLHRVVAVDVECRPCAYLECPIGHPCAGELEVELIMAQALALLGGGRTAQGPGPPGVPGRSGAPGASGASGAPGTPGANAGVKKTPASSDQDRGGR
jgi:ADP-heptose:LPS heptosyltransferase